MYYAATKTLLTIVLAALLMLLSSLLVVLGVQLLALGLIGELIIFTHARQIKEYTIEEILN